MVGSEYARIDSNDLNRVLAFSANSTLAMDIGSSKWTQSEVTWLRSTRLLDVIDSKGSPSDWTFRRTYSNNFFFLLKQWPGTLGIADDVAVFGKNMEEHDNYLHNLIMLLASTVRSSTWTKCDINIPSIKLFGCYYDAEGVHPDPAKVSDIHSLPTPSNVNELQFSRSWFSTWHPSYRISQTILTSYERSYAKIGKYWQWSASHHAESV